MPLKPKLCSQCGAAVVRRRVEDRERDVCSACGTVFYQNPLPVAAAAVLDEERRILLVKRRREPHRGRWCLPIGFAELNESIEQAALRELEEEAGIRGRVLRLLDADSLEDAFYGDLLVVTFEVERLAGEPRPGDDAEEAAYFPLERLPALAFSSNRKAIERLREVHREDWAIQDSFDKLGGPGGHELLSDPLLRLLREHAADVARLWLDEVRQNPTTPTYRALPEDDLLARAETVLRQFERWLSNESHGQEVRDFYRRLGQERRRQGVPIAELVSSLSLLRKNIWLFARGHGVWARPIEAYRALELDRRLVAFFDRALYHIALGYGDPAAKPPPA